MIDYRSLPHEPERHLQQIHSFKVGLSYTCMQFSACKWTGKRHGAVLLGPRVTEVVEGCTSQQTKEVLWAALQLFLLSP